jgi:hypothetical protein
MSGSESPSRRRLSCPPINPSRDLSMAWIALGSLGSGLITVMVTARRTELRPAT